MHTSSKRTFKALGIALASALALGAISADLRAAPAAASADKPTQVWSAGNGTIGVRWNRDLAGDLGMALGVAVSRNGQPTLSEHEMFDLRQGSALEFNVRGGNLAGFVGGSLQARGGYVITTPAGRIDLTDFRLVPRRGEPFILDVVGADGKSYLYVDRLMYELIDDKRRLAVRTMDLRITPELARLVGNPVVAGWAIADLEMTTDVLRQGGDAAPVSPSAVSTKWHGLPVPGVPGATYQADLFMSDTTLQYSRCDGNCTGDGGNGRVVYTPSSTLRNNVNSGSLAPTVAGDPRGTSSALYTADIPWWQKFSGNNEPYNNDQHPFLIWNLYRFNADGSLDQIGRSGVKHAFLTLNTSCIDNPGNSHVLGRGCSDVYSVGNNDSNTAQGPRTEIIPATNQWGRCGSIYDVNCDGAADATTPNGSFDNRLVVRESQFSGTANAGATYMFESWYLARQDINIYNSMGSKSVTFTRSGSVWAVGGNNAYKLGPVIDRWVDPTAPGANARSVEISTPEGHVKVAVKVTALPGGLWRYNYAVMNLDFARAVTSGAEPNLRVLSNRGFEAFSVPISSAALTDVVFNDGDTDATNDWTPTVSRTDGIMWSPASRSTAQYLNWGTMFRFAFTVDQPPTEQTIKLRIAGTSEILTAAGILAPVIVPVRPKVAAAAAGSKAP
jgi:hypothetical protein